jgi:hypothetical protein
MADRVQRFLYNNIIVASGTVLSATSQQAGQPVGFLRDPLRTKTWRSAVGWTVVVGFNDKIDFTEAGVSRVGTLTAGTYATAALMATAVQTAMNAAPGATNTYTVSYASQKFTIARTGGADALVLKFAAGAANFAASVHPDLGYSSTDKSGSSSYLAQFTASQSRHAILADLGVAYVITAIAILQGPGPISIGTTIQASSSTFVGVGAGATPAYSQAMIAVLTVAFPNETRRYWRLLVDNVSDPLGYSEVSVWHVGSYFQPSRSYIQGNSQRAEMLTDTSRGDQGAIYRNAKKAPKRHAMEFHQLTESDRFSYQTMEDATIGQHLFLARDALNSPQDGTVYGVIESPAEIVQSIGDGVPPDRFRLSVAFLEELG